VRIAVLDANAFWTEQLFRAVGRWAEVLLLHPREIRAMLRTYGRVVGDRSPRAIEARVKSQRLAFFSGWMSWHWRLSEARLSRAVRSFWGHRRGVLVLTYPQYLPLVTRLGPRGLVYYAFDDYAANWPSSARIIGERERRLVEAADVVICISEVRAKQLSALNARASRKVHYIPIGCTPRFMVREPLLEPTPLPAEVSALQRPVAGYIGALNERFDYQLFFEVAQGLSGVNFVLGGAVPQKTRRGEDWYLWARRAMKLPNVHFIGAVNHERIGEFLQSFDVLIMCYADTEFNRSACPAKLWGYLGTSRPIVANNTVPEVCKWAGPVSVVQEAAAFREALIAAIANDPPYLKEARLRVARQHTWDRLSARVWQRIAEGLEEPAAANMTRSPGSARPVVP